jgi:hypothetical protein
MLGLAPGIDDFLRNGGKVVDGRPSPAMTVQ